MVALLSLTVAIGCLPVCLTVLQTVCAGDAAPGFPAYCQRRTGSGRLSLSAYGFSNWSFTVLSRIWFGVALVILAQVR